MSSVLHPTWAEWRSRAENDFWFAPASTGMPPMSGPVGPTLAATTDQLNEGDGGVDQSFQRGGFTTLGLSWLFYADNQDSNGDLKYVTSADDGATWSSPTNTGIFAFARGSDIHFDGTFVHIVTAGTPTTYTRGTPVSDGTITWDSQQTVPISAGQDHTWEPSIATDSAGYPWIMFEEWDASTNARVTVTGSSTKDGTWATRAGHPVVLSSGSVAPFVDLCWVHIARLDNAGKMIAFFWYEAEVYCKVWNGASWGIYEGPLDTPLHDNATWDVAFATDSQVGAACFAWCDGVSGTYATVRNSAGTWGTVETITSDLYRTLAMSVDGDGQYQLFGVPNNNVGQIDQFTRSGSWSLLSAVADVSGIGEEVKAFGLQVVPIAFEGRLLVQFQGSTFFGSTDDIYSYLTPATSATWATGSGGTILFQPITINSAGSVSYVRRPAKVVGISTTTTPSYLKQVRRQTVLSASGAPTLVKRTSKSMTFSTTGTPFVTAMKVFLKSILANVTGSIDITKLVKARRDFNVANTVSVSAQKLTTLLQQAITATATATTSMVKRGGKVSSVNAGSTLFFSKQVGVVRGFAVSVTPFVTKRLDRAIQTIVAAGVTVARLAVKPISITISVTPIASMARRVSKSLGIDASSAILSAKQTTRSISVISSGLASVVKSMRRAWSINETTAISWHKQANKPIVTTTTTSTSLRRLIRSNIGIVVNRVVSFTIGAHTTVNPVSHKIRGAIRNRRTHGGLRSSRVHGR